MERFADILGQPAAVEVLRQTVARHQPFHAYLFHGPEAVGKMTTATAFARALLCLNPSEGEACGECLACKKFASGNHPDFRTIGVQKAGKSGESDHWRISIDQIRQNPSKPRVTPPPLCADAFYHPIVGEWKVYVIEPADLLSEDAGSALLKLLEEPPSYVVIILVTARVGMVLPTLRSRCWPVGFRLVAREPIAGALVTRGAEPDQARLFAALSEGRLGWAVNNVGNDAIDTARRATIELLGRLPEMPRQESLQFAEALREIAKDHFAAGKHAEIGDEPVKGGDSERALRSALPPVLDLAVCWFRDLLLTSQQSDSLIANADYRELLEAQAAHSDCERVRNCIVALLETKQLLARFASPVLATEALAVKLRREMT